MKLNTTMNIRLKGTVIGALVALAIPVAAQQNVSFTDVLEQPYQAPAQQLTYGNDASQFIAIWPAAKPSADVVFIHGGCWLSAYDIKHTYALSTALQQANYTVYSLEYRRTGDSGGGWPISYDDIQQAFEKVLRVRNAERPLIVSGHSAGGHFALLLASNPNYREHIDAVVGLAAITDIAKYARGNNSCERVTTDFMGGTPDQQPARYQAANPTSYPAHPQTFTLQGQADTIVHPDYAEFLQDSQATQLDGAGHFDWVHPATPAFSQLLQTLEQVKHD